MKRGILVLTCVLFVLGLNNARAQNDEKPIYLGVTSVYSPDYESAGMDIRGSFWVYPRVYVSPNFVYYFSNPPESIERVLGFNLNGHYLFTNAPSFNAYGLGGFHVSQTTFDESDNSGTDYALNIGLGGRYDTDPVSIFAETKYMIQSWNTFVFRLGLQYQIPQ